MLTTHDRTETNLLPLTQEFLAGMLGVKRNAVSIVARELQGLGAIEYSRGRVTVTNPKLLETISCECYTLIRAEIAKLFVDPNSSECDD
jgi:DNA-binding transcriptional regulator YhcF (GntR family)